MKVKRLVSSMLAISMATGMLAGCSSSKPTETTAAQATEAKAEETTKAESDGVTESGEHEPVTIRFSWWGGDSRHEVTLKALDAFMEKYPWITVEPEYGAFSGWAEKVATSVAAGTAPDVMQINWNWLYQLSSDASKFVDLTQYSDVLDLSQYDKEILDTCVVGGVQQAAPVAVTGKCLFWDKTTFDEAGIDIPKTFDDLMASGKIFQEKLGDDYYPLALYEYERMLLLVYYMESKYEKPWAADNKLNFTVEELKDGLDWMKALEDNHVMPTIAELKSSGYTKVEDHTSWAEGKFGGFYDWDSSAARYEKALGEGRELVVGDYLTGFGKKAAGIYKISMTFAITQTSEHKEEAAMLINYLLADPEGVKILGTSRGIPSNHLAMKTLEEAGLLSDLTYEANQLAMKDANYTLDPNFEDAKLKDSTGVYQEVMEGVSYGDDTMELAEYMIEGVNEVYDQNGY